ncbi:hypothetical protein B4064_2368 [Caldibacillus thermoamylovorans]|nr:hypothetical protein B4064_2368 [Caldibacillus thermoamylovorans]
MKAKNFYMDCTRNKAREEKREIEDRLKGRNVCFDYNQDKYFTS